MRKKLSGTARVDLVSMGGGRQPLGSSMSGSSIGDTLWPFEVHILSTDRDSFPLSSRAERNRLR